VLDAPSSPYRVPFDGAFRVADSPTRPPLDSPTADECEERLDELRDRLDDLQRVLYADDRFALLLVFQAMDAAGKDGTIRAVLSGVNPTGCQVRSFKQPSPEELDHDFLWRTVRHLPERGRIGVFNRSHYEEVLVVRVHPEYLEGQRLPDSSGDGFWQERFESIRDHEKHLARSGTVIVKFWLNVSREEQRLRFLSRLDKPTKHWKFSTRDVKERAHWDAYMNAYEEALAATSRRWAPWYAIPADDKPYMRMVTADLIVRTLESLPLRYPRADGTERDQFGEMRRILEGDA
jgi:PPK2 family polyphosphate:nucleotide phosphotransferase